jgi:UDP-glucose 4-epimerase
VTPIQPLRVLVTGATGRLGRSVAAALAEAGHEPVSVDVAADPTSPYDHLPADLARPGDAYAAVARYRPDAVVHLAALAVPFSRPEHTLYATNTALAFNVLQASVDLGVRRIAVASSPTVVGYGNPAGWEPSYLPLDEEHPTRPWHAYGLSKLAAEAAMRMFAARHGDDVRFAAFRPCFVIAPEDWAGAPTQDGRTIAERLDLPELGAVSLFNYVDARDAGRFVVRLVEQCPGVPNGDVFFVGAGDALVREPVAEAVARHVPSAAAAATTVATTGPLFSNAKAKRLLGWAPEHSWRTELT